MLFFKMFLCFVFMFSFQPQTFAGSIAETAAKMAKARAKKAELEKHQVRAGETVDAIGNLTIEDFLELEAVPDGMDAVSAQALNGADETFDFMTTNQAIKSIAVMRKQGIDLPEDLEKEIRKNPEKASQLMNEAFEKIPPAKVSDKEDISRQRKALIKEAESNLGIKFKDVLNQQKRMMESSDARGRKRGGR